MTHREPLLQVRDLRVDVGRRNVLKSISLDVPAGGLAVLDGRQRQRQEHARLTLAGHPRYRVAGGQVVSTEGPARARRRPCARAGLFVSMQAPPDIPGVKNNLFVRTALNAVRAARGEAALDAYDFLGDARATAQRLGLPEALLNRPVNDGFSGGERKRNELLQLALLRPRLAVLDEIDSGLDVDGVRTVVDLIQEQRAQGMAFLVVSHYLQLIEALAPDAVLRLDQGCIAETGGIELAREIAERGFARAVVPEAA
ncbi:MAG: Fe-S cluster assembly ATPase SufC [Rubrivivax sp.]